MDGFIPHIKVLLFSKLMNGAKQTRFHSSINLSWAIRVRSHQDRAMEKNQKSKKLIEKIISGEPLYGPVANLVRVSI
jgi:hypothetical protein